jgi:hypothetical protein
LTLALTRHVGCTAGIYRRLWPLQMTVTSAGVVFDPVSA